MAYSYNTLVHSSICIAPFDLVVTNLPGPLILKRMPGFRGASTHRDKQAQFRAHVRALISDARTDLVPSQDRCKQNFNVCVRPLIPIPTGDHVFLQMAALRTMIVPAGVDAMGCNFVLADRSALLLIPPTP